MTRIHRIFLESEDYDKSLFLFSRKRRYQNRQNFKYLIEHGANLQRPNIIGNLAMAYDQYYIDLILTQYTTDLNAETYHGITIFNLVAKYYPQRLQLLLNYSKANDDIIEFVLESSNPYLFEHLIDRGYKIPLNKTQMFYRMAFDIDDINLVSKVIKYCNEVRTNDLLGFIIAAVTTDDDIVIKRSNDYLIKGYEAGRRLRTINQRLVTNFVTTEEMVQVQEQFELEPERDIYDILMEAWPGKILRGNVHISSDAVFAEYILSDPKLRPALDYITNY